MIYKFIDDKGTFIVSDPQKYNTYLPLTNKDGSLLSSISPSLSGDIKKDNDCFLTPPASIEDIKNNLLCRREFFIKTDTDTFRLSYPHNDNLEIGFLYQKLNKKTPEFNVEVLNFIPFNLQAEVMQISISNAGDSEIEITPTSFIPIYARSEKNLRDHRHVTSLLNRVELDKFGIVVKPSMVFDEKGHKINETMYFVLGYENNSIPITGQFPTLDCFYGEGSLLSPDAVEKNIHPADAKKEEFDGKEACAAFRFSQRKLKPGENVTYFLIMGITDSQKSLKELFNQLDTPEKIKTAFEKTKEYWLNYLDTIKFDFKDNNFNNWLLWVKLQPALRKLFGCSFLPHFDYGKGGRGWRDLWQDALALLLTEPDKVKQLILNNFKGVRVDGSNATVVTKEGNFIADRNRIARVWMDHGVWPYLTLRSYIHKNADLDILLKEETYFRDGQLKRAKEFDSNFSQKDCLLRAKNKRIYKGTILEHVLIENLVQFFNVGKHNIIRLENADWNDGLDMASTNGESATFSFMYAYNLGNICLLLEKLKTKNIYLLKELKILLDTIYKPVNYNDFKEKQKRLEEYLEKTKNISGEKIKISVDSLIRDLRKKSEHMTNWLRKNEWLKTNFFNGYYDNKAKRVEGDSGSGIRMMLPSQVFAIMSEVADKGQIEKIWDSINKYLSDKQRGGFRLNTNFGQSYTDLGRAFGFSYGDKENGAFFNHMVVMLSYSLYSRGFAKEGFRALDSIYKMATAENAQIYPMIPEYFNSQGKGLYSYLTGSASWYIYSLLEQVLGIQFKYGDLIIKPGYWQNINADNAIKIKFVLNKKNINLTIIKTKANQNFCIKEVFLGEMKIPKENETYTIKRKDLFRRENSDIKIYL